jgi:formylglycine-generating enzyme required for sulfatase activity
MKSAAWWLIVSLLGFSVAAVEPVANLQAGIDALVVQLGDGLKQQGLTTVAILDLLDLNHNVSTFGRYIAERSITAVHRTGKFTVIERDLLERTLKKLNLTVADLADPANVQLLGKALGIQALVKGSVSDLGDTIEINTRLVRAAESAGQVISVAQVTVKKDTQTAKLMGQMLPSQAGTIGLPADKPGQSTPPAPPVAGDALSVDLGDGITLELLPVNAGSFEMGSTDRESGHQNDEALHRVTIAQPFYIGRFEITEEQWEKVMGANPVTGDKGPRRPVREVSWDDCQKFLAKLNEHFIDRLPEGCSFRLPTEAEWEYACRAGTQTAYSYGDDPLKLGLYAWYGNNSDSKPHDVGTKRPNPWGIYDMHGNVWEWCQDKVGENNRANRGGSWITTPVRCRSSSRDYFDPSTRYVSLGFRVVVAR